MKTIAIITFLYFLLCGYATENNQHGINQVNMKKLSPGRRYEIFTTCQKDTSANSFTLFDGRSQMWLNINSFSDSKQYLDVDDCSKEGRFKLTTYTQFLNEFSDCLKFLSQQRDLSKLLFIDVSLSTLGDIAIDVTNNYDRMYPNNDNYNEEDVIASVYKTSLVEDINNILSPHGLEVSELGSSDYHVLLLKKEILKKSSIVEDSTHIPLRTIDAVITISLKRK